MIKLILSTQRAGIKHCCVLKKKSFTQTLKSFSKRTHITNVTNTWLPLITAKSVKQYQCNGPSGRDSQQSCITQERYFKGGRNYWVREKEKAQR